MTQDWVVLWLTEDELNLVARCLYDARPEWQEEEPYASARQKVASALGRVRILEDDRDTK